MRRAARAVIDLAALRHNLQRARHAAPKVRVLAVVKADAYGHGIGRVVHALDEADGFGVTCLGEALALREIGADKPILAMQGFKDKQELLEAAVHRIGVVLHSEYQLPLLTSTRLSRPVDVWLKVDTGMRRLGFGLARVQGVYHALRELSQVAAMPVLMTHLACADDSASACTRAQLKTFDQAIEGLGGARSIANSAGVLAWPQTHGDWVRPGIMLYGAAPFIDSAAAQAGLRPVMTLTAPLVAVRQLNAGDTIGYAGTWTCPQAMPVGVVAIGYADGYPRHAPSGTPVLVNGRRSQLVGRVCMDMITVDLRGCEARPGDPVTLWGKDLPVDEVARCAGTVGYELLCSVGARVSAEAVG